VAIRCTRPPTVRFTQVRNEWVRDRRLTWKARGLLTYLHSHADGYELSLAQIIRDGPDGKDAVGTGLAELESLGYLARVRSREAGGRWGETDYTLADPFDTEGRLIRTPPADDVREIRQSGLSAPDEPRRTTRTAHAGDVRETRPLDQGEKTKHLEPPPLPLGDLPPRQEGAQPRRQSSAEEFAEFWAAYPRKVGKADAQRAWAKATRRTDAAKILDVVRRYPWRDDPQFVPYPATWLNRGCWEDDLVTVAATNGSRRGSGTRSSMADPLPPRDAYTYGDGNF
jgi:hypothetical protein